MNFASWCIFAGCLLVIVALSTTVLKRLPLSTPIVYLAAGVALSPFWLDALSPDLPTHAQLIEHLTEIVVLVSLFTSGLKLSTPVGDRRWTVPVRLATLSMVATVAMVAGAGWWLLGMSPGAAILLGGILAPTDPVLASDVQVAHAGDKDSLKFALTGEGGLNDGTAFPFVVLGLGLMGHHEIGEWGWRWLAVDVVWSSAAGLLIGAAVGMLIGTLVIYLRKVHKEAVGLDNFIALGVIALSYGLALQAHAYGFLAVFAAGFAFRQLERWHSARAAVAAAAQEADRSSFIDADEDQNPDEAILQDAPVKELVTHQDKAGAYMAREVLTFNEQIERIGEVAAVVLTGALLWTVDWTLVPWWFIGLVFLAIRPASVFAGLIGASASLERRVYLGWFGIRGIGSLYYLAHATAHGLAPALAAQLGAITLATIVTSVVLHGLTVTPLMHLYESRRRRS